MIFENVSDTVRRKEGIRAGETASMYVPFYSYAFESRNVVASSHCHKETEIIFMMEGTETVTVEEVTRQLKAGDILVIPPYADHAVMIGEPVRYLVNGFDANELFAKCCAESGQEYGHLISSILPLARDWPEEVREEIRKLLLDLNRLCSEKKQGWMLRCAGLYAQLIARLLYDVPHGTGLIGIPRREKLRRSLEYVAAHFQEEVTLKDCAAAVGFNPNYFSHYFVENMNMTFHTYLSTVRIQKARELLIATDLPIADIADASGFESQRTFHRNFSKITGMTPTRFREETGGGREEKHTGVKGETSYDG